MPMFLWLRSSMRSNLAKVCVRVECIAMKNEHIFQQSLVNYLTSNFHESWKHALDQFPILADEIVPATLYRLEAYRTSCLARLTTHLSAQIIPKAQNFFGKDVCLALLFCYFSESPPRGLEVGSSIEGLLPFLEKTQRFSKIPYLRDLIEAELEYSQLLYGPDPVWRDEEGVELDLSQRRLSRLCRFLRPSVPISLPLLWERSENDLSGEELCQVVEELADSSEVGILFLKVSPLDIEVYSVPSSLCEFFTSLSQGRNVQEAMESLPENLTEEDASIFQNLLTQLSGAQAI